MGVLGSFVGFFLCILGCFRGFQSSMSQSSRFLFLGVSGIFQMVTETSQIVSGVCTESDRNCCEFQGIFREFQRHYRTFQGRYKGFSELFQCV